MIAVPITNATEALVGTVNVFAAALLSVTTPSYFGVATSVNASVRVVPVDAVTINGAGGLVTLTTPALTDNPEPIFAYPAIVVLATGGVAFVHLLVDKEYVKTC